MTVFVCKSSINVLDGIKIITWPSKETPIRDSPPKLENQIMARVCKQSITHSTMYQKAPFCKPKLVYGKLVVECGFSSIKIDYYDYLKNFIRRINEVSKKSINFI